jgi:hypothetical protein
MVFRVIDDENRPRRYVELARTKYKEDAVAIYDKWNSAYIVTSLGDIIASKGF